MQIARDKLSGRTSKKPLNPTSFISRIIANEEVLKKYSDKPWSVVRMFLKPIETLVSGFVIHDKIEMMNGDKRYGVRPPIGARRKALELHGYRIAIVGRRCFLLSPRP